MCAHDWHYSALYGFWYIPEHPEAGRIFEENMPPELKDCPPDLPETALIPA